MTAKSAEIASELCKMDRPVNSVCGMCVCACIHIQCRKTTRFIFKLKLVIIVSLMTGELITVYSGSHYYSCVCVCVRMCYKYYAYMCFLLQGRPKNSCASGKSRDWGKHNFFFNFFSHSS